jgi:hypothetical protein
MSAIARRQRLLDRLMIAATVAAVVAVPVLGYTGVRAVLDSTGGRDARGDNLPIQTFPSTPAAAWFVTDDDGGLAAVAVLVLDPSRQGGSLVDLPVNADVGFVPEARRGLHEVFADEGIEGAMLGVEALTAVSLEFGFESDAEGVAEVFGPLGTLNIDLAVEVDVPGWSAPLSEGVAALDPDTVAAVVTEPAATSAGGFDGHRANVNAIWTAAAEANGSGSRPAAPDPALPTNQAEFLDRFFAGRVGTRPILAEPLDDDDEASSSSTTTLPDDGSASTDVVASTSSTTAPDGGAPSTTDPDDAAGSTGDPLVMLDRADAVFVFASIAPGSMSGPAAGLLFRLEAPPGYDAEVKRTVEVLLYFGGNVVSIDSTIAPRPDTVFIVPDEVNRDEAEATNGIFGDFSFVEPQVRIDGVDLTVVLGTEYLEGVDA